MLIFAMYLVTILCVVLAALYLYRRSTFSYWKKRNVTTLKKHNVIFGDFSEVLLAKKTIGERYEEIYDAFGDEPYGGVYFFGHPILLLKDEALFKQVFIKDFSNFHARGMYSDPEKFPLSGHLFSLSGPKWRRMRLKLTPTFTTGKIKIMFETLMECSEQLNSFLEKEINIKKNNDIDMKELLARFGIDVVASVAFGIQCNCIHNPNEEFRKMGDKLFRPTLMLSIRALSYFFVHFLVKTFNIAPFDPSVAKFMTDVIHDMVNYRETNGISRPDFLNLLIELKKIKPSVGNEVGQKNGTGVEKDTQPFTMDEIVAQSFLFFAAGFETTSTTTGFCLYELALHQDIQDTVRREIGEAMEEAGNKVTYELISQSLPFTDKVVSETLRLHPALPFLTREAADTVELRAQSGKSLVIHKGQQVAIPISGIQRDPKFYPNPEIFDPERFSAENCEARPHFAYMPFGEGPRICIGMRFALVQVKLSLLSILSKYRIETCPRTPNPMKLDPKSLTPLPKGGLYLRLVPLTKS